VDEGIGFATPGDIEEKGVQTETAEHIFHEDLRRKPV
jgi:hypothetical protein